jgi:hypothetical protein
MAKLSLLWSILYGVIAVEASLASRYTMARGHPRIDRALDSNRLNKRGQPSRPVPNAYLNKKTKPYWVDGSALPEVSTLFDVSTTLSRQQLIVPAKYRWTST